MPPASRRIFLYWFLLLVPTLVVGGVAIQLLRHEQARLTAQGAYAREAREAAVTARARLIVENVELLVGDVETGLLDTLAAESPDTLDEFMAQWEANNPLVRTTFRCSADGRLLRPTMNTTNENERGFVRRFSRELSENPPWAIALEKKETDAVRTDAIAKDAETQKRKEITSNVAQVQSARRNVQELVKARTSADFAKAEKPDSADLLGRLSTAPSSDRQLSDSGASGVDANRLSEERKDQPLLTDERASRYAARQKVQPAPAVEMAAKRSGDALAERRGWLSRTIDGRLHLLGWVQPNGSDDVRGVEAELSALVSRLAGALPAELAGGEGYALLDDRGRVLHQVGAISRDEVPVIRVPVAASLLPGWEVVAYLPRGPLGSTTGVGFFWVSVLLVGIFVMAILTAGQLLLRQARRSEAEAAQKTSFVANVSHEFKTPLTTIRLYAELLEQGRVRDAAQGGDYLRTIGRETQRLARLINNVLDFSRLEQGRKKFARERLELSTELSRLLQTHAPRIAEAGLTLDSNLPSSPLPVTADRDALEQIILNLVDNACKYASEGGTVTLSAAPRLNGGAEVRVSDRGPGVPAEQRELIFEKFHRVDDSLRAEKTGAGLGLSIARQLARGMGGDLRYEARSGGGAEFILQLP